MKLINDIRISAKIATAFMVVCIVIIVANIVNIILMGQVDEAEQRFEAIGAFQKVFDEYESVLLDQRQLVLSFMITGERSQMEAFQRLDDTRTALRQSLPDPALIGVPPEDLDRFIAIERDIEQRVFAPQIALMRRNDTVGQARAIEITPVPDRLMAARDSAVAKVRADVDAVLAEARHAMHTAEDTMRTAAYVIPIVSVLLAVVLGMWLTRLIARPIKGINAFMNRLSDGHLDSDDIPGRGRRDEIGEMAESVEVFREGLIKARDLSAEQKSHTVEREREQKELRRLVQSFEGTVVGVLDGLSQADHLLRETAGRMSEGSQNTMETAQVAGNAATGASQDVNTMAASAEELSSSIQEIARRVAEATTVASRGVAEADASSREIAQLDESVARIGEVVGLINDIASQTNLLALNATIEAARAGDAGKGFAVVANEVKGLATQTARATEDVAQQISAIQSATKNAVGAIGKVTGIIREIDEISSNIAAAVEEQGAATAEIARGADHTAEATMAVVERMSDLQRAAQESRKIAQDIRESSDKISAQSAKLKTEVREFLTSVQRGSGEQDELVRFDDSHMLGNQAIDDEHRKLMEVTNDLYRAIKTNDDRRVLDRCFAQLKDYTTQHFANENTFMERSGYPQKDVHLRHHEAFIQRLGMLYESYRGGDKSAGMDLLALLGNWWRNHMEEDDMALAEFARRRKAA